MKFQKWMFIASIILFLGAIALVVFTILTPFNLTQRLGWWHGPGNGGPMAGRGYEPGFGMRPGNGSMPNGGFGMGRGRGGMFDGGAEPGFGMMGPGGGRGQMMGPGGRRGGPEDSLISVAAEKLGLTPQELTTQLQAGKTIADVAKEKDVAVDTIVEAVLAPRVERLKGLVDNKQLTQGQADAMTALMKANVTRQINEPWTQGGRWGGPENSLISVAAEKLGLTSQELTTQLQAGKTIADIAKEKNVTTDTIIEAVLASRAERLKGLVDNKQLTQEQADAQLALMKVNLTKRISEPWPHDCNCAGQGRMRGRWGGGRMMGNWGGW